MTKLIKINPKFPEIEKLKIAVKILKQGGIVAFPTETVYGLGGNFFNKESIKKIYKAKGRPSDNPLIAHVSDEEMLNKLVLEINSTGQPREKFIKGFW